jgi:hypothetical protein
MSENNTRRGFLGKLLGASTGSAAVAAGLASTSTELVAVEREQSPAG